MSHIPYLANEINISISSRSFLHSQCRLLMLESRCQRTRLELEDQADWCSSSTMEYIQHISREPSLFPTGINVFPVLPFIDSSLLSTSYAICRVVLDQFSRLPSLRWPYMHIKYARIWFRKPLLDLFIFCSSPYSLYCTRDRAVGLPSQLADVADGATSLLAVDETLDTVVDRLYPLLPLSRWVSSQTMPHHLAQFLAASG